MEDSFLLTWLDLGFFFSKFVITLMICLVFVLTLCALFYSCCPQIHWLFHEVSFIAKLLVLFILFLFPLLYTCSRSVSLPLAAFHYLFPCLSISFICVTLVFIIFFILCYFFFWVQWTHSLFYWPCPSFLIACFTAIQCLLCHSVGWLSICHCTSWA